MDTERHAHLIRFYSLLDDLEYSIGGARRLSECSGRMDWPKRGVYFFREPNEHRTDTGSGPRVVRVGTHALRAEAGTKLWGRLRQHKGRAKSGTGDHRGSIFRLIVGTALISRHGYEYSTWGDKGVAKGTVRNGERVLEGEVSQVIGQMPFVWLAIDDAASPESMRGYIERNSIALLSNYNRPTLDPPSQSWLGHCCDRERVRSSGLWNSDHVDEDHDPEFLDKLDDLVSAVRRVP